MNHERWEGMPCSPAVFGERKLLQVEENLGRKLRIQWCCFIPFSREMKWIDNNYEQKQKIQAFDRTFCCYCREDRTRQLLSDPYDESEICDKAFIVKAIVCSPFLWLGLPLFCDCEGFLHPEEKYGEREKIPVVHMGTDLQPAYENVKD